MMSERKKCPACALGEMFRVPCAADTELSVPEGNTMWHAIPVVQYVCERCGFIQRWVEHASDLEKLKSAYVLESEDCR